MPAAVLVKNNRNEVGIPNVAILQAALVEIKGAFTVAQVVFYVGERYFHAVVEYLCGVGNDKAVVIGLVLRKIVAVLLLVIIGTGDVAAFLRRKPEVFLRGAFNPLGGDEAQRGVVLFRSGHAVKVVDFLGAEAHAAARPRAELNEGVAVV